VLARPKVAAAADFHDLWCIFEAKQHTMELGQLLLRSKKKKKKKKKLKKKWSLKKQSAQCKCGHST